MIGTFIEYKYLITSYLKFGSSNSNEIKVEVLKSNDAALPDDNNSTYLSIIFVDL